MSTKSTILNTPHCHIYYDYAYNHGDTLHADKDCEVLVIEVYYDNVEMRDRAGPKQDNDTIIVLADSDFASFIIFSCYLLKEVAEKSGFVDVDKYIKAALSLSGAKKHIGIK